MMHFIRTHQVILAATLSAILMSLQQALKSGQTDAKVIAFAVFVQVVGVIAHHWMPRGKALTTTGIIGTLAGVLNDQFASGQPISWNEFILSALLVLMATASGGVQPLKKEQ